MATYLLRNSLNPGKVVSCLITFRQLIPKEAKGEPTWVVEIQTSEPHKAGGKIKPFYINYTSETNLDKEINLVTEQISKQIDWGALVTDLRPPFVSYMNVKEGDTVKISSNVVVDIEDILPAAGIDIDSIKLTLNGVDVTNDLNIEGDPYKYRVSWNPAIRVLEEE